MTDELDPRGQHRDDVDDEHLDAPDELVAELVVRAREQVLARVSERGARASFADVQRRIAASTSRDAEDALDMVVGHAREQVTQEATFGARREGFAEVVRRAHELDPVRVDAEKVREAEQMGRLVVFRRAAASRGGKTAVVSPTHEPRTPIRSGTLERRSSPARRVATTGLMFVAASVAALWMIVPAAAQLANRAAQREQVEYVQARVHEGAGQGVGEVASLAWHRRARLEGGGATTLEQDEVSQDGADAGISTVENLQGSAENAGGAELEDHAKHGSGSKVGSEKSALAELAAQADRHWRLGELAQAEALLRQVTKRGGKSSLAEDAFGDLFLLAHQRGAAGAMRGYWQEYVRKFPKGRYADDARAGLCRTASSDTRSECWQRYLLDFPEGSFRTEAITASQAP